MQEPSAEVRCSDSSASLFADNRCHPLEPMAGLSLVKDAAAVYTPSRERGHDILVSEAFVDVGFEDEADAEALIRRLSGAAGIIDATGCLAVPGLVDMHVHVCGGGGEAGVPVPMHIRCVLPCLSLCGLLGP